MEKEKHIHALASSFLVLIPCRTNASSSSPKPKAPPWLLRNRVKRRHQNPSQVYIYIYGMEIKSKEIKFVKMKKNYITVPS